jgi:hypothetical protein
VCITLRGIIQSEIVFTDILAQENRSLTHRTDKEFKDRPVGNNCCSQKSIDTPQRRIAQGLRVKSGYGMLQVSQFTKGHLNQGAGENLSPDNKSDPGDITL